jgi:TonB family protein
MYDDFPPAAHGADGEGAGVPGSIRISPPDIGPISPSLPMPQTGTLIQPLSPEYRPMGGGTGPGQPGDWASGDEQAEVLTSPLPVYPDLLRQAGVEGQVILEAVVDTTGRVLAQSILVVAVTHPGFVAPARQALLATLFRPAMVAGKAVRTRVRVPYEFAIRNGAGGGR